MNKELKKIFLVLIFYAFAGGMFYSFEELWLSSNNLSTKSIGIVLSLCALLCVSTIFLCSNLINKKKLKKFTCTLFLLKALILISLFFLNSSGLNVLIKFLIMMDYVVEVEIYACIYPMIALITKNNKIYALRRLVYSSLYYLGVFLSSILLGNTLMNLNFSFNTYCFLASISIIIAFLILVSVNLNDYIKKSGENDNGNAFYNVLNVVKKDKITKYYLSFLLIGQISYASINGLLITLLTSNLGFTAKGASTFNLVVGISAALLGILILQKLTLKNDYINFSIKFVGRLITYILAAILNSKIMFLIAIIYTLITSESYIHVYEAPYINRFSCDNQLALCNLKEMITYLGKSIGNLLCGFAIILGTRFNFLFSFIFCSIQIVVGFLALNLRLKETGDVEL